MTGDKMVQLSQHVYRPAKNMVLWACILMALNMVCYVVALPLNFYGLSLLGELKRAMQNGEDTDEVPYAQAELAGSALMVISVVLFVSSAILIACWINRAHKNARALGVEGIRHSPVMAVVSFFIPIVSFFMPYQAMKQMVSGSLALIGKTAPRASLLIWWLTYLAGMFSNRISAFMTQKAAFESQDMAQLIADIDTLMVAIHLENLACICLSIAACLLFALIRRTERAHVQIAAQQGLQAI